MWEVNLYFIYLFLPFVSPCLNVSIFKFLKAFNGEEGLLTSAILHNKKKSYFQRISQVFFAVDKKKSTGRQKSVLTSCGYLKELLKIRQ